jgi:holo-[acyl-carrier protein] synthase
MIVKSVLRSIHAIDIRKAASDETFFSSYEHQYCFSKPNPFPSLAGIWCAKVALTNAIAQFPQVPIYPFSGVEIRHEQTGRPRLEVSDRVLKLWCQQQEMCFDMSISHAGEYAIATILIRLAGNTITRDERISPEETFTSIC